jgi:hypothetical protein
MEHRVTFIIRVLIIQTFNIILLIPVMVFSLENARERVIRMNFIIDWTPLSCAPPSRTPPPLPLPRPDKP